MDDLKTENIVSSEEDVVRLVNNGWVEDGELLYSAFAFAPRETYLSVNRPIVETYEKDVRDFVSSHPAYKIQEKPLDYRRALMHVNEINMIKIVVDDEELAVKVEVEPRDVHTKSHAGIFARIGEQNMVIGRQLKSDSLPAGVSTEIVLQKLAWELKDLAELQLCRIAESE